MMIIRAAEQPLLDGAKSPLVSRRLLTRDNYTGSVSMTWIQLNGAHARQNSGTGDRFYYILSGAARFSIGDEPPETAGAGDIVCPPKNVDYVFEGDITYLYVNAPAS